MPAGRNWRPRRTDVPELWSPHHARAPTRHVRLFPSFVSKTVTRFDILDSPFYIVGAMRSHDLNSALSLLRDLPIRIVFGPDCLSQIGSAAKEIGARRALLVTDPGIVAAGHVERALSSLRVAGAQTVVFDGAAENPTTQHVDAGLEIARSAEPDALIGLGGGSAMDCAKGINLLLTNGGRIADYWGINKAVKPLLPLIAVPTTAGTGSEAQSFALISDEITHRKMACGDRRLPMGGGLRPRAAILDPDLIQSAPHTVAAAAGMDALAHAVETSATNVRNPLSRKLSKFAWDLLISSFGDYLSGPGDSDARAGMLLGAHLAGAAIEQSMLGAAHAAANPLTARFGIRHGQAVGLMLPHVVRFNCAGRDNPYSDLESDLEKLVSLVAGLLDAVGFPSRLSQCDVPRTALPELAELAALEWTAQFNPVPVTATEFLRMYEAAC